MSSSFFLVRGGKLLDEKEKHIAQAPIKFQRIIY